MPLFMDVHDLGDAVGIDEVAKAHVADLAEQDKHDEISPLLGRRGARQDLLPCRSALRRRGCHRPPRAHGLVAQEIHEVREGS
nr:DUF4242 domain-containing protein [Nocardioides piscis]